MEFFEVQQPPTGGELLQQATNAYLQGEPIEVVLLSEQEVPRPEPETLELEVLRLDVNLATGSRTILGNSALFSSIIFNIGADLTQPAKATAVRPPQPS